MPCGSQNQWSARPWLALGSLEHRLGVLLEERGELGDLRHRRPQPEREAHLLELLGQPRQAMREAVIGHPVTHDVPVLPAVVDLHVLQAQAGQRSLMTRAFCSTRSSVMVSR